jgi:hypothetical protein
MSSSKEEPYQQRLQIIDEKELFNYTKELLLAELNWRHQRGTSRHQWHLRLLWLAFSAAFLGLCASSQDFQNVRFELWQAIFVTALFNLMFLLFDCHLTDLWETEKERAQEIEKELEALPRKSVNDLLRLEIFKSAKELRENYSKRPWWQKPWLKVKKNAINLEYGLFYGFTMSMWVLGWLLKFGCL